MIQIGFWGLFWIIVGCLSVGSIIGCVVMALCVSLGNSCMWESEEVSVVGRN
jgi:hypothetical protein